MLNQKKTLGLLSGAVLMAAGVLGIPASHAAPGPTAIHVDCGAVRAGDGSPRSPLNDINQLEDAFGPGQQVLFKRGTTCVGNLVIDGSGTVEAPTKVGAYGEGEAPIIDGDGSLDNQRSVIEVDNQSHFVIEDLVVRNGYFSNVSVEAQDGATVTGVTVQRVVSEENAWKGGANEVTDNMWVMGVGGIVVMNCSNDAQVEDVVIDRVHASDMHYAGVQVGYHQLYPWSDFLEGTPRDGYMVPTCYHDDSAPYPQATPRDGVQDVRITNSSLHDNDAMGAGVFGATDVLIRNNDLYRNGSGYNPNPAPGDNTMNGVGAWWDTTENVTAEWNNAWGNREGWTGNDGTGLDADRNTINSVIQNNYLHDNANYGASLISAQDAADATFRYNVIADNGRTYQSAPEIMISSYDDGSGIPGEVTGLSIYGNTIHRAEGRGDGSGIRLQAPFIEEPAVSIANNIIDTNGAPYSMTTEGQRVLSLPGTVVTSNLTRGASPFEGDVSGEAGLMETDPSSMEWPTGDLFRTASGSPAVGIAVPYSAETLPEGSSAPVEDLTDFWGHRIAPGETPPAVGADAFGGTAAAPGIRDVDAGMLQFNKTITPLRIPVDGLQKAELHSVAARGLPKGLTATLDEDGTSILIEGTPREKTDEPIAVELSARYTQQPLSPRATTGAGVITGDLTLHVTTPGANSGLAPRTGNPGAPASDV